MFDQNGGSVCESVYAALHQVDSVFGTLVADKEIDGDIEKQSGRDICGADLCKELSEIGSWSN